MCKSQTVIVCRLEWGTYLFFAFWAALMTIYAAFFLPETKGVPLEEMQVLWSRHWFWGKFVKSSVSFRTVLQMQATLFIHHSSVMQPSNRRKRVESFLMVIALEAGSLICVTKCMVCIMHTYVSLRAVRKPIPLSMLTFVDFTLQDAVNTGATITNGAYNAQGVKNVE